MSLKRKYLLSKFLFHMMKEHITDQEKLFQILGDMKGIPQKYGQFLYLNDRRKFSSFENLLDEGVAHQEKRLLQRALKLTGGKIDLMEQPMASASIGQIYGGKLGDDDVIVKIQYPHIKKALWHDWKFVKGVVSFAFRLFRFPPESKDLLLRYLEAFEETIEKETDYTLEADFLEKFQKIFQNHEQIYIPKVYPQFTRKELIVEERCKGLPLKAFLRTAGEEEKREILHILASFYFESLFQHQILHGDPHSANFFVEKKEGRLVLQVIDYGCVKEYPASFVENLREVILSLQKGDHENVPRLLTGLGFREEEILSYGKALVPILKVIFEPFLGEGDFDFRYWRLAYKLNTIMGSKVFHKTLSLPEDLLILFRVFHGFVSHMGYLANPSFALYPYLLRSKHS
ncbi:AarF/UbiB family protein [Thermotalea metallivorans]|uniref:ABC1 atypical kinase-like domain-containing protein n=1 Tax=Thermotalea metallivorans TaxID=520762 RepID=A0A140L6P9_9FIRM|nr:AarF/UbiB family protein [Thermotalea metallivorans]KXG76224.1 putative protein kinase UbiB [Thermotalea metallivorans]